MKKGITLLFIVVFSVVFITGVTISQNAKPAKNNGITVRVSENGYKTFSSKAEYKKALQDGLTTYQSTQQSLSKNKPCLPASPVCGLLVPKDGTFTELTAVDFGNSDDGSSGAIPFGFDFSYFGTTYNSMYVGLNGYITFDAANNSYSAVAFPYAGAGYAMIAAFFADVYLTAGAHIWYKVEAHRVIVIWENVGYYNMHNDKTNTFEIIITDQTNNEGVGALAGRNNLALSYGLMQWTTGDFDGGTNGFGGTDATVGVNKGDGLGYFQVGRFSQDNSDYLGRMNTGSGIGWLSYQGTSCTPNLSFFQYDVHANTFVSLNSPVGGENWRVNTTRAIEWRDVGSPSLSIDLSTDGGSTWSNIASGLSSVAGDGSYLWAIPNNINTTQAQIKIYDRANSEVYSQSQNFSIFKPYQVIFPNGGEMIPTASAQVISWYDYTQIPTSPQYPGNDKLQLSKNAANNNINYVNNYVSLYYTTDGEVSWNLIVSNIRSYGDIVNSYSWQAPSVASNLCKIKIQRGGLGKASPEDIAQYSKSDNYFTLYQPINFGQITLTTPNGGEKYTGGSYNYISWRRSGVVPGSQSLEFSLDGGATWSKITSAPIGGVMRYSWLVPRINSDKCLVRICNGVTGKEYDRSNSFFSVITPTLLHNYPNPFNPSTKISFSLERNAFTTLRVYNTIGQQVAELVNQELKAGVYEYEFNAQNLPSGVYLYNLTVDGKSQINKMMLLK